MPARAEMGFKGKLATKPEVESEQTRQQENPCEQYSFLGADMRKRCWWRAIPWVAMGIYRENRGRSGSQHTE
jgi:hypothetical protein